MKEVSAYSVSRGREHAGYVAERCNPLYPVQVQLGSAFTRQLWPKVGTVDSDVSFLQSLHRAEFLQHYHKRSNVETTFHMIKSKFGQRLRSKSLTAQINKALCKVLCHNLCVVIQSMHELNITPEFCNGAA